MFKNYQNPTRLELKLPLAVIESCWLMNANSAACLTALSSDSVRLNIFMEKSNDHARFLFQAVHDIPVIKVLSDLLKCSVESILEHETSVQDTSCHQHKSGRRYTQEYGASASADVSSELKNSQRSSNSEALRDSLLYHDEQNGLTNEPHSSEIQVKNECDDMTSTENEITAATYSGLPPCRLKADEEDIDYPSAVSEVIENANSENQSDGSSLSNDDTGYDLDSGRKSPSAASFHQNHVQKNSKLIKLMPKFSKQGICPHCGVYYGNLSQHMFTYCSQNPERRRVFHCCYCKFKSHSKEELVEHKTSHVLLRDFKCEMCDSGFFTRNRLIRHMRYVHLIGNNPVKIYTCDICDKRFRYRSHYDRHITIHQDEKSVQCEMCGKFFKNKHNVHNHQSRMHPFKNLQTAFPYFCEKCGEGFLHLGRHRCSEPRKSRPRNTTLDQADSLNQEISSQMPDADQDVTAE